MAIRFVNPGDALKRTTGVVPGSSDYTVTFRWRRTSASGGGNRQIFVTIDDPTTYNDYASLNTFAGEDVSLDASVGGVDVSTATYPSVLNQWEAFSYVRSGTTHSFYRIRSDGTAMSLVGSCVNDFATAVLGQTWLGDDSFSNVANQEVSNFREWDAALTPSELLHECNSATAVRLTNLVTDTPLISDLLDISGHGHHWTAVGSPVFFPTPPNIFFSTAIDLGPLPAHVTQQVDLGGTTYDVYYSFIAPADAIVVGAWAFGDLAVYMPSLWPYQGPVGAPVLLPINRAPNAAEQFPVTALTQYFLKITPNAGNPSPANLTLDVLVAPDTDPAVGDIAVPDDHNLLPLAVVSSTVDYTVKKFVNGVAASEVGDIASNGVSLIGDKDGVQTTLYSPSPAFALQTTIAEPIMAARYQRTLDAFYVAIDNSNVPPYNAQIKTVLPNGTISGVLATLTGITSVLALAASNDGSTLYFSGGVGAHVVKTWNMGSDTAGPDLVPADVDYRITDILVLEDGTLIVLYVNGGAFLDAHAVHFSAVGATLHTYALGSNRGPSPSRLAYALDSPNSFWAWMHPTSEVGVSHFLNIKISDGSILTDRQQQEYEVGSYFSPATATPSSRFGNSFSCPFFIVTASVPVCVPVTVTVQPESQSISSGSAATLSVTASGTAPIDYQWYQGVSGDTSHPIPGATSSVFVTPVLTVTTTYWVRVTNPCGPPGTADSTTATISLPAPPTPPTLGPSATLLFDIKAQRWFADKYPSPVKVRTWEPGQGVHDQILGHFDGTVDVFDGHQDQGADIIYEFQPPDVDAGDPRMEKTFGDAFLSVDPKGGPGFYVTPGYNDYEVTFPVQLLGAGLSDRQPIILDFQSGTGIIARNFGIAIIGADSVGTQFFLWEIAFVPKVEVTDLRATDWDDAGYFGAKFMQGLIIEADTLGVSKSLLVQFDGGQAGDVFTLDEAAQEQGAHSFATPFIAHLVRLVSLDYVPWRYYRTRWIWEPSPELVAVWETQPTTLDLPGFHQEERAIVAYISTQDATLTVNAGGQAQTYALPNSNGAYVKLNILERPNKALWYSYRIATNSGQPGIRVFQKDLEIRQRAWGSTNPYQSFRPFGDESRTSGARI